MSSPPKFDRIRRRSEFASIFARGRSLADYALVLYWRERTVGPPRVGFCVGKQLGKAVTRNRIKRLLRESWRVLAAEVEIPADLVFVARRGGVCFSLAEWVASMRGLLRRAKLLGEGNG
ncbi:MAG: ribonuclease P protein component [Firmicutes bacterium]|nr:ribonuclease P protein component [Bacillota bacterium]